MNISKSQIEAIIGSQLAAARAENKKAEDRLRNDPKTKSRAKKYLAVIEKGLPKQIRDQIYHRREPSLNAFIEAIVETERPKQKGVDGEELYRKIVLHAPDCKDFKELEKKIGVKFL